MVLTQEFRALFRRNMRIKKKKKIEKRNYSPDRSFKIAELTAMKLCNENVPCHGVDFPEEDLFELESEG